MTLLFSESLSAEGKGHIVVTSTIETKTEQVCSTDTEPWLLAHEAFPEVVARSRRRLGGVALSSQLEVQPVIEFTANSTTLLANIHNAALGDERAYQSVLTNIETDMAERLYKSGHQTEVQLQIQDGVLAQSGNALADIQMNALRYTELNEVMRARTKQELENVYTFEELLKAGVLDTHNAVVFSLCPQDKQTIEQYHFYKDTASCSIQLLEKTASNDVKLQTALVAGKATPTSPRHDRRAVEQLVQCYGDDALQLADEDDSLRAILLVPKTDMPRGVLDIVRRYDEAVGSGVFYGKQIDALASNYESHRAECAQKAKYLSKLAHQVADQLMAEASQLDNPVAALKRLNDLNEELLVLQAVQAPSNTTLAIDENVFGQESAGYIRIARERILSGDTTDDGSALRQAIKTADSSSCPMNFSSQDDASESSQSSLPSSIAERKYMRCPYCGASQFGDPCARVLQCYSCSAKVVDGKVKSRGDGRKKHKKKSKMTSSWL